MLSVGHVEQQQTLVDTNNILHHWHWWYRQYFMTTVYGPKDIPNGVSDGDTSRGCHINLLWVYKQDRKNNSPYHCSMTYSYTMENGSYFRFDYDNKIKYTYSHSHNKRKLLSWIHTAHCMKYDWESCNDKWSILKVFRKRPCLPIVYMYILHVDYFFSWICSNWLICSI